jgi:hypothetical protein
MADREIPTETLLATDVEFIMPQNGDGSGETLRTH